MIEPRRGTPVHHELKTWPSYFDAVRTGAKAFEVRKADRDFRPLDVVTLREFDPATGRYSGRTLLKWIGYVSEDLGGIGAPGMVAFAIFDPPAPIGLSS